MQAIKTSLTNTKQLADFWQQDKATARALLEKVDVTAIEKEWIEGVIDGCTDAEKKELREGLEFSPYSLWFDYENQRWID